MNLNELIGDLQLDAEDMEDDEDNVDDIEVGRPVVRSKKRQKALFVRENKNMRADGIYHGMEAPLTLAPGATATATWRPVTAFKALRFVVPSEIAPDVVISNIQCGAFVLSAGDASGIPGSTFSEVNTTSQIEWPTIQTSQPLTMIVTNVSAAALVFRASFLGWRISSV